MVLFSKQYKRTQIGKRSTLTNKRIELLNAVDFAWDAQAAAWENHYNILVKFKNKLGHCHVPLVHPEFPKLGLWVKEQRRHYNLMKAGRRTHMNLQRSKILDDIGFCWDTHDASWLARFQDLVQYKKQFNHCNVPKEWAEDPALAGWVASQRRLRVKGIVCKKRGITTERINMLTELGFDWGSQTTVDLQSQDDAGSNGSSCNNGKRKASKISKLASPKKKRKEEASLKNTGAQNESHRTAEAETDGQVKKSQRREGHAEESSANSCDADDDDERTISDYSTGDEDEEEPKDD